jgi:hypothetical protein
VALPKVDQVCTVCSVLYGFAVTPVHISVLGKITIHCASQQTQPSKNSCSEKPGTLAHEKHIYKFPETVPLLLICGRKAQGEGLCQYFPTNPAMQQ